MRDRLRRRARASNGGYLPWVRLPDRVPSMALYQLAFEAGITLRRGRCSRSTMRSRITFG
ncbi:hypothetical protein [Burkholderia ubonensis]|uniref:hypothetical protein n=1 Tax=Burkholderia ubonensis TaxID=101571 RepID=UPI00076C783E|nr:hypothetical protein [Burkholderia ubonensis]KVT45022.1 hypothetical protein WK51_06065 [Burkholderia ubonensis]